MTIRLLLFMMSFVFNKLIYTCRVQPRFDSLVVAVRKFPLRPHPEGWGMDAPAFRRG
ncbi:MAG: hypothetical protein HY666_03470 [Chloroflexi bacterium]|nr:hypothetical protein [Chloroflexota bacterium]